MSRLFVFILPAIFAAAVALLWDPASQYWRGLQQPLGDDAASVSKGFPTLKLNDGREIPAVRCLMRCPRSILPYDEAGLGLTNES